MPELSLGSRGSFGHFQPALLRALLLRWLDEGGAASAFALPLVGCALGSGACGASACLAPTLASRAVHIFWNSVSFQARLSVVDRPSGGKGTRNWFSFRRQSTFGAAGPTESVRRFVAFKAEDIRCEVSW